MAIAGLAAAVVGPLAYVTQRLSDYAIGGDVDPLSMLSTTTVAYYWRCAIAAFWAGLGAIAALFVARRASPERLARSLALVAAALSGLFLLLSWLYP